jgi:hypothetical protein
MKLSLAPVVSACLAGLLSSMVNAQTNSLSFQSSVNRTSLLELYTSEGCSSCPPAETWLSRLKTSPGLWRDFVPVAFHVDYWDYLGWKDPWGAQAFSARQRLYAARWHSESVYTPEFILNGNEWRDWSGEQTMPATAKTRAGMLTINSADTNHWHAIFTSDDGGTTDYELHAALLACGVKSNVKAGENRGRNLMHDFAVVRLADPSSIRRGNMVQGEFDLDMQPEISTGDLAVAAWVTKRRQLEPLQATGGWIFRR